MSMGRGQEPNEELFRLIEKFQWIPASLKYIQSFPDHTLLFYVA